MPNATIISASLDSKDLENSINKLVSTVKNKTNEMANHFTKKVSEMEASLKKLNSPDFGGSKSRQSSSMASGQKELEQQVKSTTQAIREEGATYDQLAQQMRNAVIQSQKRYDVSPIQNLRMQQHEIEAGMKTASAEAARAKKDVDEFNAAIEAYRRTMASLPKDQQGFMNHQAIQREINDLIVLRDVAAAEQTKWNSAAAKLGERHKDVNNQIRAMAQTMTEAADKENAVANAAQKSAVEERKAKEEAAMHLEYVKDIARMAKDAHANGMAFDMSRFMSTSEPQYVYAVNDARSKGMTIEQQIENILRMQAEAEASINTSKNQQLDIERQISQEVTKRTYKTPTTGGNELFRKMVGSNIGLSAADIDATSTRINKMSTYLKQLQDAYANLTDAERRSPFGKQLRQEIQETSRLVQKFRQEMSRPISFDAVNNMKTNTIDDMLYKMRQLQSYKNGIDLTKDDAAQKVREVDNAMKNLQKDMDKYMVRGKQMNDINNALGRSWNYMKNRLAFYFTVGASTAFIKNLIEVRSQYEMNERALGILINSAERGSQVFKELSDMALVSPYTLIELSNAAKQLTAYDIAAKDVVDTTRRLADMASAVGVPMERLTYALGQIKAYGYLNSRDARMFANAGIPLVKQLSEYYSELEGKIVSIGDVYDRMKKKAIDYNDVMAVVTKMTDEGGKFFDFQAKMADTLKVRLANLTLAWNNMLNEIGQSEQGVLTGAIGALKELFLQWKNINNIITKLVYAFGLYKAGQLLVLMWTGKITTAMGVQELVGKKLQARLASLSATSSGFVSAATVGWAALALVAADMLITWQRNSEEIERLNKALADNAKEAADALDKTLHSSEMVSARLAANQKSLTVSDAEKTWGVLREQLELSAASAKDLVAELLKEEDLNERVTMAFNLAERIQEATAKLGDFGDKLNITQDSILMGFFGEGVIEDIEDYNNRIKQEVQMMKWAKDENVGFWESGAQAVQTLFYEIKESFGSSTDEAKKEIDNFAHDAAESIRKELGEEGLKDKIQIREAIARIQSTMEQQFPQIKGSGKMLFETIFNDIMAEEFKGAVDKQAYYYNLFLNQLKKDHASAFGDVTDEILDGTHKWSQAQIDAINKTADKVRNDLPEASRYAIDEILNQLNSTEFKVRIVAELATSSFDEVQKQFRKRFITHNALGAELPTEQQTANLKKYGTLMRKEGESNLEYEKRISEEKEKQVESAKKNQEIIEKNQHKQDAFSKAVTADAQKAKTAADEWVAAANKIEKEGGYDFTTKSESKNAKKNASAAKKAQKEAESELQKALKDEIQLIDKVRAQFKKLTDAGYDSLSATAKVTNQFNASISNINKVLGKNGLPLFDIKSFSGTDDPNRILKMLEAQLKSAQVSKNIKPSEIKDLEVKYSEIVIDADVYNLTKVTKGLNNQLDRLKEDYELAVTLDAEPELGDLFANYWGINMETLPKTAEEYARRYTQYVDEALAKMPNNTLEIPNLLNLTKDDVEAFRQMVDDGNLSQKVFDVILKGYTDSHDAIQKEFKETAGEWDKLLEKYSEFQYKQTQIQKQANKERATLVKRFGDEDQKNLLASLMSQIEATTDNETKAGLIEKLKALVTDVVGDDRTKMQLQVSIDTKEAREQAKLAFEEFQKTPDWITATGDLTNLTDKALMGLIDSINEYKRTATKLDPKQIRQMNKALSSLHKELRKGNPFHVIADAIDDARERASIYDDQIAQLESKIEEYYDRFSDLTEEERASLKNLIETLNKVKQKQEEMQKIEPTAVVEGINNAVEIAAKATEQFTKMAEALGGKHMTEASETINNIMGNIQAAGQGAAVGAQFGGYGAAIGATAAGLTDLVTRFADQWSGNRSITKKIVESEREVKKLEIAYVDLQHAIDKAYGSGIVGAKHAMAAAKELELAELERQLRLEESRKSKNRDDDKILELKKQIKELRYEINNTIDEITNDLLGTEVGSFAEDMVKSMIDAFKKGEDYMQVFEGKFEEMVDNMIMKAIVSKVVASYMDRLWASMDERISAKTTKAEENYKKAAEERKRIENMSAEDYFKEKGENGHVSHERAEELSKMYLAELEVARNAEKAAEEAIVAASEINKTDIAALMDELAEIKPELGQKLKEIFGEYYTFGSMVDKDLSALQQGIQSITEPTANALEAYANGISQQTYLQSDILVQIRDMMTTFNLDVQLATVSQILLQLQASYQVQMSIQGIMQGWSTPNGMGVRVEML